MSSRATIQHVVPLAEWNAHPDAPYTPASLAKEGFVHCSPDEETTLAIVNAFYQDALKPLVTVVLDVDRLTAKCAWEAAAPAPPPGISATTLFPHVFGPLNREAVVRVLEVEWDDQGRATGLAERD